MRMQRIFRKICIFLLTAVLALCCVGCDFGVSDEDTRRVAELTAQITEQLETLSAQVEADPTDSVAVAQFLTQVRQKLIRLNEETELPLRIQGLEALQEEIRSYLENAE